jgi:hypothetical protein
MIELDNRKIFPDGTVVCNQHALKELLYADQSLDNIFCSDEADSTEWQSAIRECDVLIQGPQYVNGPQYEGINWYHYWNTPEPYASINVIEWCRLRCKAPTEVQRTDLELDLITKRGMIPLIRHLIYCVDIWRQNNIVWGVGRGSSVCSFVLFLVGINRINPIEHNLDIREWLK